MQLDSMFKRMNKRTNRENANMKKQMMETTGRHLFYKHLIKAYGCTDPDVMIFLVHVLAIGQQYIYNTHKVSAGHNYVGQDWRFSHLFQSICSLFGYFIPDNRR